MRRNWRAVQLTLLVSSCIFMNANALLDCTVIVKLTVLTVSKVKSKTVNRSTLSILINWMSWLLC